MKIKICYILVIFMLLFSCFVVGKPKPNNENQYYIFGDNTDAIPILGFNWSNNETYLYPYNESLFYMNETGVAFDLANVTGNGVGDGYAGDMGHPHNQDLNTTDNVTFYYMTAKSLFGDGGNLTNITVTGDGYAGDMGHPHNQDLNTTDNVNFHNITCANLSIPTKSNTISLEDCKIYNSTIGFWLRSYGYKIKLKATPESPTFTNPDITIYEDGIIDTPYQSSARARLTNSQSVSSGLWTKLTLSTEDYDLNSDYNITSTRFIAPVKGLYQISYSIFATSIGDQDFLYGGIYKNGILTGGYTLSHSSTVLSGMDLANSGCDILQLNRDDFIELYVYHTNFPNSSFPNVVWSNYLAICKIA